MNNLDQVHCNLIGWKLGGCGIFIYSAWQGLKEENLYTVAESEQVTQQRGSTPGLLTSFYVFLLKGDYC